MRPTLEEHRSLHEKIHLCTQHNAMVRSARSVGSSGSGCDETTASSVHSSCALVRQEGTDRWVSVHCFSFVYSTFICHANGHPARLQKDLASTSHGVGVFKVRCPDAIRTHFARSYQCMTASPCFMPIQTPPQLSQIRKNIMSQSGSCLSSLSLCHIQGDCSACTT